MMAILLRILGVLCCVGSIFAFRSSISLRRLHFTDRWVLRAYNIPVGGWTHTTFSLRERLPSDIKEATETNCDVSFWNNVKGAVDKIETEGKTVSDRVMLQIMEPCTTMHFAGHPERIFDFSGIDIPKDAPAVTGAAALVTTAVEVKPDGAAATVGELTAEEATNIVIEVINAVGATSMKDMGKVMTEAKPKLVGRFDVSKLSEVVKKVLSAGPPFVVAAVPAAASSSSGEVSPEEVTNLIIEVINSVGATSIKDMGKVMGEARSKLAGKVDMSKLSDIVKKTLTAGPPFTSTATSVPAAITPPTSDGATVTAAATATVTDDELGSAVREAVSRLGASSMKDMGRVMTDLKGGPLSSRVEPARICEAVKRALSENGGGGAAGGATVVATIEPSTAVSAMNLELKPADVASAVVSPLVSSGIDVSDEEVMTSVKEAITRLSASSLRDMGKVMADVRPAMQSRGLTDMGRLSEAVKKALSAETGGVNGASITAPTDIHVDSPAIPSAGLPSVTNSEVTTADVAGVPAVPVEVNVENEGSAPSV